jgi:hypothetical protein
MYDKDVPVRKQKEMYDLYWNSEFVHSMAECQDRRRDYESNQGNDYGI